MTSQPKALQEYIKASFRCPWCEATKKQPPLLKWKSVFMKYWSVRGLVKNCLGGRVWRHCDRIEPKDLSPLTPKIIFITKPQFVDYLSLILLVFLLNIIQEGIYQVFEVWTCLFRSERPHHDVICSDRAFYCHCRYQYTLFVFNDN